MLVVAERQQLIEKIRRFPAQLREAVRGLTPEQLITRTLPKEWTVQQIVHHLADSHMNSIVRLKLVLTLERPHLQGYPQEIWADLPDVHMIPIESSLAILEGLHARWCAIWDNLSDAEWSRVGIHSENGPMSVEDILVVYAAHGENHLDQIARVIEAGRT